MVDHEFNIEAVYCDPSIEQFAGYIKDYLIDGSISNTSTSNYTKVESQTSSNQLSGKSNRESGSDNLQGAIKRALAANDEAGLTDEELDEETKKYIEIDKSLGGGDDSVPEHQKSVMKVKDSDEDDDTESDNELSKKTEASPVDRNGEYDDVEPKKQNDQKENNNVVDDAIEYTDLDKAVEVVESDEDLYDTVKDYHSMKPTHLYKLHDFTRKVLGGACSDEFFDEHNGVTEDQAQQFAVEFMPKSMDQIDEFSSGGNRRVQEGKESESEDKSKEDDEKVEELDESEYSDSEDNGESEDDDE
jgi:hypothetical protein